MKWAYTRSIDFTFAQVIVNASWLWTFLVWYKHIINLNKLSKTIQIFQNTTYPLAQPGALDPCAEVLELVACDWGSSQESKCISTAISKFPLQASSNDFAIAFVAPVTLTNWSTRLGDIFALVAILKIFGQMSAGNIFS